jgi:hypothetical protein
VLQVAIKVDVDTWIGLKEGVPRLLALFRHFAVPASFFIAFGPDNSGKALRRIFKRGFLHKMWRTNAVRIYGVKTLLCGTLLPSPIIGDMAPELLRAVLDDGHELGIHGYDHVLWQDRLQGLGEAGISNEIERAIASYVKTLKISPQSFAAPGWQATDASLAVEDAGHLLMLLWASMFLLFFALSRARLPQYCLPAMPALALLIGMSLDKRYTGSISSTTGLLIATAISALLPALALLLLPSYLGQYHQLGLSERAVSLIRVVFGLMVGASALALLSFARRRWLGGLASLTVGMVAAFYCTHQVLLQLQPFRSSQGLAKLIAADPRPGGRIVLEVEKDDPFEHEKIAGLVFYTGQSIDLLRRKTPPSPRYH